MQFDRYLFGQMIRTTIAVSVTLVGIMWLFQTIRLLEVVINRGAPISNFLLMSVTVIPLWLTIAVPVSAFVAVIWVFQRAVADRELLVMQASGRSALQLAGTRHPSYPCSDRQFGNGASAELRHLQARAV